MAKKALPFWAASATPQDPNAERLANRDMVFIFESGETDLSPAEQSLLTKWLCRYNPGSDNARVHIGGALETSRMGRMRRLSGLVQCFAKHGFQRRSLQVDRDWTLPTRVRGNKQLPSDVVWMQIR